MPSMWICLVANRTGTRVASEYKPRERPHNRFQWTTLRVYLWEQNPRGGALSGEDDGVV